MTQMTNEEIATNTRRMQEKINDDVSFLNNYGSIRTGIPSQKYRDNFDLIFGNHDRKVDANSSDDSPEEK